MRQRDNPGLLMIMMLTFAVWLWILPAKAMAVAVDLGHGEILVVAAIGVENPNSEAQRKNNAKKEQEAVAIRKNTELMKFSIIWGLIMLAGVLLWVYRPRKKPWLKKQAPVEPEEEDEEVAVILENAAEVSVNPLRDQLVSVVLEWQEKYGVSPVNLAVLAALDAALQVGMSDEDYAGQMLERTQSSSQNADFVMNKQRYIVKAYRQNLKLMNKVRYIARPQHMEWDVLIFITYDPHYMIIGAWEMLREDYMVKYGDKERLLPEELQVGRNLTTSSRAC